MQVRAISTACLLLCLGLSLGVVGACDDQKDAKVDAKAKADEKKADVKADVKAEEKKADDAKADDAKADAKKPDPKKPEPKGTDDKADTTAKVDAKSIYDKKCKTCHGPTGNADTKVGKENDIPDWTVAGWKAKWPEAKVIDIVKNGKSGTKMKPFKDKLTEDEIVAVSKFSRSLGK